MIPWHLRWGQALSEGVHVIVLLLQCGESHLLLLLNMGIRRPQALHLRGQTTTGGRCGAQETHGRSCSLFPVSDFCWAFVPCDNNLQVPVTIYFFKADKPLWLSKCMHVSDFCQRSWYIIISCLCHFVTWSDQVEILDNSWFKKNILPVNVTVISDVTLINNANPYIN